jgi:hypothetical protein
LIRIFSLRAHPQSCEYQLVRGFYCAAHRYVLAH